ncbi:MAG: hypothetical protein PHU85_13810 [Phycisphaerae bacterium]|nr:hypothetical protein [Phycisphaerae bacterium]
MPVGNKITIYIPLRNEGVPVWRPTLGVDLGGDVYRVLPTEHCDPGDEEWEFLPGSVVRCQREINAGELLLIAKTALPLCPVCGYEQDVPPWTEDGASDEICPCCGIQFGYSDCAGGDANKRQKIYKEWRRKWYAGGMEWWSKGQPVPAGWDRYEQLRRVGVENYSGMTTNERLVVAGLLDKFDRAARNRNRADMVFLLTQVQLATGEAERIADTVLAHPKQ